MAPHDASSRLTPRAAALLSVGVGVAVLAAKLGAWRVTGSVALYSDALESIVNVVAALAAFAALSVAARPPDARHPYGHHKAEYFSAVFEGVLIILAAVSIVLAAWERFREPAGLASLGLGVVLSAAASAANGALAAFLVRTGRRARSPALIADGMHLWTDVATSAGVLVGIGLAALTGWWILDPLLAIVVALNIVRVGLGLVRDSVGGLMDEAVPPEEVARIHDAVQAHLGAALQAHGLRTRRSGPRTFVEFHLVVDGAMAVREAHALCEAMERAIADELGRASVTIHVEPEGELESHGFVVADDVDAATRRP